MQVSRWRNFCVLLKTLTRHISMWLLFVALVAVLPLVAAWIIGYTHSNSPTMTELFAEGDGFLIAIAIAADAIGRVTERLRSMNTYSWLCAIVLSMALIAFVTTKTEIIMQKTLIEQKIKSKDRDGLMSALETPPNDKNHIAFESKLSLCFSLALSFIIVCSTMPGSEEDSK